MILGNGDGQINLKTVRPHAAILLAATNGIGTVPVPIKVDAPVLSASTIGGDINIEAIGNVRIPLLSAPLGSTNLSVGGDLAIDHVTGRTVTFKSPGDVDIATITATLAVNIAANSIHAGIVQPPGSPSPLVIDFTGPNGTLAQNIGVTIDAPGGTNFTHLFATDVAITTNSAKVGILDGFVPGMLDLVTASQHIVLDNRNPSPRVGPSMQLYGPGKPFVLIQNGNAIYTTDYVVSYGVNSAATALSAYDGMSFVRDFPLAMQNGAQFTVEEVKKGGKSIYVIGVSPAAMLDALAIPKSVESVGTGPAVNLEGL
jgi:hypothetical protein